MTSLYERMSAHPEVRIKDLGDGIVACNFTSRAFREGMWDKDTTAARGLFLDTETSKVLARGYEKFFGLDEWQGHDLNDYLDAAVLPATVTEKGNGYLGILSLVRGNLTFYSKSGPTVYSEHFEKMFRTYAISDEVKQIITLLADQDASLLFEVIDPFSDPHIVQYDEQALMILDLVKNSEEFMILDKAPVLDIFKENDFFTEPVTYTVQTREELEDAVVSANNSITTEGVVIRDANGFMVKVKSAHYKKVKSLRGALTRVMAGKEDSRATPVLIRMEADGKDLSDFLTENVMGDITIDLPKIAKYIV